MAQAEPDAGSIALLERALGLVFRDRALLRQALTHRSAGAHHNERLEFLGDALLGFLVAESLFHDHAGADEGELTRRRAALVNRETLAAVARELDLGRYLFLGEGEMKSGGWRRESILANGLEAVIGAVYLDAGLEAARALILRLLEGPRRGLDQTTVGKDAKTELQELLQARGHSLPVYETIRVEGAPHAQEFTVCCRVPDSPGAESLGSGSSRRRAEQAAARAALKQLGYD